jgi:ABC-2 type transport system permease protein
MSDPAMAPMYPKGGPRNPMMEDREPQPEKGSIVNLLRGIGISWNIRDIAWDSYNPHPEFAEFPRTYAFIGAKSGMENAFHVEDPVTADLQEMVLLDAGIVEEAPTEGIRYRPLLLTSPLSGTVPLNTLYRRGMFGMEPNPNARYTSRPGRAIACRVTREKTETQSGLNVIFIADIDFISNTFFQIRRMRRAGRNSGSDFQFDNVTFLLNAVDSLAGDDRLINLRKRRPEHRTLTRIEAEAKTFDEAFMKQKEKAEDQAGDALKDAQGRLTAAVKAIEDNTELDEMTKEMRILSIKEVEQRKFDLAKIKIDDEKDRLIEEARSDRHRNSKQIKDFYKRVGWLLSPILGIAIGLFVTFRRLRSERESIPVERQKSGSQP